MPAPIPRNTSGSSASSGSVTLPVETVKVWRVLMDDGKVVRLILKESLYEKAGKVSVRTKLLAN